MYLSSGVVINVHCQQIINKIRIRVVFFKIALIENSVILIYGEKIQKRNCSFLDPLTLATVFKSQFANLFSGEKKHQHISLIHFYL